MPAFITVEAAPPSMDADCAKIMAFEFTFYMMYQSEMNFNSDVYFTGIKNMLTLKNIMKYGTEVSTQYFPRPFQLLLVLPTSDGLKVQREKQDFIHNHVNDNGNKENKESRLDYLYGASSVFNPVEHPCAIRETTALSN